MGNFRSRDKPPKPTLEILAFRVARKKRMIGGLLKSLFQNERLTQLGCCLSHSKL
jgi:hypothetical protein